jgi:hypothetical protein
MIPRCRLNSTLFFIVLSIVYGYLAIAERLESGTSVTGDEGNQHRTAVNVEEEEHAASHERDFGNMAKRLDVLMPKWLVKYQDEFVQLKITMRERFSRRVQAERDDSFVCFKAALKGSVIYRAEVQLPDRVLLPHRKRRDEVDAVAAFNAFLQHAERERAQDGICSIRARHLTSRTGHHLERKKTRAFGTSK